MNKKLLYIAIGISMFPGFLVGISSLKKDITTFYCFISKSCNQQ